MADEQITLGESKIEENSFENEYKGFISNRITELRLLKNVSEYQMSLELGQNGNYIRMISNGSSMPKMGSFLRICEYLGVTPAEFFDPDLHNPGLVKRAMNPIEKLDDEAIELIIHLTDRISEKDR